jgi:hypothetical protein
VLPVLSQGVFYIFLAMPMPSPTFFVWGGVFASQSFGVSGATSLFGRAKKKAKDVAKDVLS